MDNGLLLPPALLQEEIIMTLTLGAYYSVLSHARRGGISAFEPLYPRSDGTPFFPIPVFKSDNDSHKSQISSPHRLSRPSPRDAIRLLQPQTFCRNHPAGPKRARRSTVPAVRGWIDAAGF